MGRIADRLRQLGIELPPPKGPVANYLGCKRSGELLFGAAVQLDMVLRMARG